MSKARGKRIVVKFDKELLGDVSGKTGELFGTKLVANIASQATITADSSNYGAPTQAADGSTSTYWGTSGTLPNWIRFDFGEPTRIGKFRHYSGGAYRPRLFVLEASDDAETWNTIISGEFTNSTGWKEFDEIDATYRYWRMSVTSRWSSRTYTYEIELIERVPIGNEQSFTVTAMQRNPLRTGEPELTEYTVDSVERHTVETVEQPDAIVLLFDEYNRFNDVEGAITVAYDQALGNLTGTRAVESFSVPFTPLDLEKTPIDDHTVSVGVTEVTVNLLPVTYIDRHTDHTVSVGVTEVTVALIHVNDINP